MSRSKSSPPEYVWLGTSDCDYTRDHRHCPECGSKVIMVLTDTPAKGQRSHEFLFQTWFANVTADGRAVRGGIELYLCSKCMVQYAYGPRRTGGGYRMVRMPC